LHFFIEQIFAVIDSVELSGLLQKRQ